MKYFVIFLILIGFSGTAFAQYMGDSESNLIWPPVCIGGPGMCQPYDEWIKGFFHDAISGPFDQSDNVIVGTIIEIETLDTSLQYSIQVDFYLKNTQSFDLLTATLDNPGERHTFPEVLSYNSPIFDEDDLVLVYLKNVNGEYKILPQSFAIDKHEVRGPPPVIFLDTSSPQEGNYEQGKEILFSGIVRKADLYQAAKKGESLDVNLTIYDHNDAVIYYDLLGIDSDGNYNYKLPTSNIPPGKYEIEVNYGHASTRDGITIEPNLKYWTPLKQFKSGISIHEIDCKDNFVVAIKNSNGNPACVKPETKVKLMERGWAEPLGDIVFTRPVPADPTIVDVLIPPGSASEESENYLIPKTLTVVLGVNNTVRWINENDVVSTLVSDQPGWSTGRLLPGESATVTFNKTGVFGYHGTPHPWKTGTIIVKSLQSEPDVTDSLKIPNAERDVKLAAGYKLYPGVGWVHPDDLENQQPIYRDNPNNPGELILDLDAMIKEHNLDQEINVPVYPRFANGVTEIINPEFDPLKYRAASPVIDETYLSKNVEQWHNAWRSELDTQYGIYGDEFYTELGRLLMKNEMQYQMNNLGIINANDDFEVYSGMVRTSLPPHIGFSAVIYATDENYYRLEGGTFANQVSYYRTSQLQFPDTREKLSIESIISNPQLITILPEDGHKARQEPSTLVVHVDNSTVEFFNNTPEVIRIQDSGSGRVGEENTLDWMGPTILPYQKATMTFDKPGLIEWDARNAPNLEDPLWWETHAGGNVVVLSDDMDDFSRDDKARIAQKMLHNSDIPLTSSGAGNAEKVLKLGLDPAVAKMVPNAEEYYLQRAHQLIPFDVEIVMYE